MKLGDAVKTRKSVKRFLSKKVDWRRILRALDYARFAPMSGNLFSMKFILVRDGEKIEKLAEAAQQDFVKKAKYVVVVVSDDSKAERNFGERGKMYARQQAGAAIQNFLLGLREQKLATTWVGHFVDEQVKDLLEIPEEMTVEAMFPIGKEMDVSSDEKNKLNLEDYLFFDEWSNKLFEPRTKIKYGND